MQKVKAIKNLLNIARPKRSLFFISVISILAASFFEVFGLGLAIPIVNSLGAGGNFLANLKVPLLKNIIIFLNFQSDLAIFVFLMFLVLGSVYCSDIFLFISTYYVSRFSHDLESSLREKIFSKYLSFEKPFYDRSKLGSLISIMIDSPLELTMLVLALRSNFVDIIMASVFLVFLFVISWKFSLLVLPLIVMVYFPLNWLIKKIKTSAYYKTISTIDLSAYSADILANIRLVKTYANEKREKGKFLQKSSQLKRHSFNVYKKQGALPRLSHMIAATGFLFLIAMGVIFQMKSSSFSLGRFLVYFYVLRRFIGSIGAINEFKGSIARITPIAERINWVFDDSDKYHIKDGSIIFEGIKDKIRFNNLNFQYIPDHPVLKNINFEIKKNETVAIVGPTGSGKTTLAHLLLRLYDMPPQMIEIDGIDIREFKLESLRKKIAIVTQDILLLNDTIRNNITYGLDRDVSQEELDEVTKKAHIYDFIMQLPKKYENPIGDRAITLSGGEKQRISIARAILKNTDILILDEATSSMDVETEMLIQEALENLMKNKTVLAIAHRLFTIRNSDRIIVLEEGRIVEDGSFQQLLETKKRFYHYWELQKFY